MVRAQVGHGGRGVGGLPFTGGPTIRVPCPNCDAKVGEACRIYKVENGERTYLLRHTKRYHPERRDAARRAAGEGGER